MRLIILLIILILFPSYAYAYIGPGVTLGAVLSVLTLIGLLILVSIAIIIYPLKNLYKKLRNHVKKNKKIE